MNREEAKHKLDYMKKAYQKLIDEKVDSGKFVGDGISGEWKAETPLDEAYKSMIDALEMAIKALEQEPCGDCISREAVEKAIKNAEINFTVNSDIDFTKHKREVQEIVNGIIDAQIKALRDLPSVTQQPEVGRWIYDKNIDNWKCSKCDETPKTMGYCGSADFMAKHFKYCNHCGAKMQEVEE